MEVIKNKFKDLKLFNWSIFIALCLTALIPAVYQTIRTYLVSVTTSTDGIDVIGQMEWFDLINETLLAFLVVPLYSVFNKINKDDGIFSKLVFKLSLIIVIIYLIFQLVVFIYASNLVSSMNSNDIDINLVSNYLKLETIAFIVSIIYSISNVIFIILGKQSNVYILLITNAILLIISDYILIPMYGVIGVAYSNILINSIISIMSLALLIVNKAIKPSLINRTDIKGFLEYLKTGLFSGMQIFLDNIIYAVMVVKMVNMVAEQGNYWTANNFIWGYLLIPISALGEIIKKDSSDYKKIKQSNYYLITIFVILIWIVSIPLWSLFYQYIERLDNYKTIFDITIKLFPFYIAYSLTNIVDNIFIGLGKTYYNAINSIIINIIYYGIFFILYLGGNIEFSMNVIILMFGFGMVVHLIVSYIEQYIMIKRGKILS